MTRLGARFGLGVIILLIGALILLELVANIQLPIFRLVVGLGILLIGVRMVLQAWNTRAREGVAGEAMVADLAYTPVGALARDTRFDVVLGRGTIDLTHLAAPDHDVTVTVDTLFGRAIVRVPPELAYDVEGTAAFGQVRMPDHRSAALGNVEYHAATDKHSRLHLRVHAVFGACEVVETPLQVAS